MNCLKIPDLDLRESDKTQTISLVIAGSAPPNAWQTSYSISRSYGYSLGYGKDDSGNYGYFWNSDYAGAVASAYAAAGNGWVTTGTFTATTAGKK